MEKFFTTSTMRLLVFVKSLIPYHGNLHSSKQRANQSPLLTRALLLVREKEAVCETQTFSLKFGLNTCLSSDIFRFKVRAF